MKTFKDIYLTIVALLFISGVVALFSPPLVPKNPPATIYTDTICEKCDECIKRWEEKRATTSKYKRLDDSTIRAICNGVWRGE